MENNAFKILAIDDNRDNLIAIRALVGEAFPGARFLGAENGLNGLGLAKTENPDVILLDIFMPEMDGFAVCQQLKTNELTGDIPVVFLTALKGDKESRIKALEVGAEAFLSKPIDETELAAQIRAMVKIKEANAQKKNEKEMLEKMVEERTRELQQSQQQLKSIFENLQDAYFRANAQGRFIIVSPSATKMFGYLNEELLGMPAETLYANPAERSEMLEKIKATGRLDDFVLQGKRKDGSCFWVSMSVQLLWNDNGGFIGTEGLARDITDRKLALEQTHYERKLLRTLIDNLPFAVYVKDKNARKLAANTADIKIMNCGTETACIGKTDLELFDTETGMDAYSEDMLVIKSGIPIHDKENCYLDTEGKLHWRLISKFPIFDNNGNVDGLIGMGLDITDRKMAELALAEINELNSSLLRTIPFAMDIVDETGNILFHNQLLEYAFGRIAIGMKCWHLYRDDKTQCTSCPLHKGIVIGETSINEIDSVLGGRSYQISHTGMLYNGKPAMLEIFQDITDRKN